MKKILLIGAIISSFAFANTSMMNMGNNNSSMDMKDMKSNTITTLKTSLTEVQQKELDSLREACKKAIAPLKITVEEKDLAVKKELLNGKPDWTKIEGILKEKASTNAQIELIVLKTNNDIKVKFGITDGCNHMDMGNMDMSKDMKSNMKM